MSADLIDQVDERLDHTRGQAGATVSVVEYGDFECPFTRALARPLQRMVETLDGRMRLTFRHFPLRAIHPRAQAAAEMAEAAALQGRFWEMHDALFRQQLHGLLDADLRRCADALGLDAGRVDADLATDLPAARVQRDVESGRRGGVSGTPTLFVDGVRYTGEHRPSAIRAAILEAVERR